MILRLQDLDVEITKSNAKEIYYFGYMLGEEELKFYYENYSDEEFLKWNDEYINKQLDICESYFNEEISLETLEKHIDCFLYKSRVFVNNKKTYRRILEYLKKLNNDYGYFINYFFEDPYGRWFDFGPSNFGLFKSIYIGNKFSKSIERERKYVESHYHYFPNSSWCGLIHEIHILGFDDVLNDLFEELLIPILENYQQQKYFCNHKINYIGTPLRKFHLYYMVKEYIIENKINAPKRLKEILEIE